MKKLISLILASAMTVSIFSASVSAVEYGEEYTNKPTKTYAQKFNDVPTSHWAFSYVGEMNERGVVSGYPNGNFYPNNNVTRAEFAKIMTIASGIPISTPQMRDFSDVATDAWYAPYVHAAYPYLSGYQIYGGNYYKPDTPALREDIAVALVKLKGYDTLGADESILATMFTDVNSISSEARKYVATALERGLISGYDDNTFRGQDSITRAEATAMLWRAYQYGNDNKIFDNEPTDTPILTPAPTPTPIVTPTPESTPTLRPTSTPRPTEEPTPTPTLEPTEEPTPTPDPTETPVEKSYIIDTIDSYNSVGNSTSDGESIYFYDHEDCAIYKVNDKKSVYLDINSLELSDGDDVFVNGDVEGLYYDGRLIASIMFYGKKNPGGLKDIEYYDARLVDITDPENPIIISNARGNYQYTMSNGNYIMNDCVYDSDGNKLEYIDYGDNSLIYNVKGNDIYCITNTDKVIKYDFGSSSWKVLRDIRDECDDESAMYTTLYEDKFYLLYEDGTMLTCDLEGNLTKSDFNAIDDCEIVDFISYPESSGLNESIMYITDSGLYFFDSDSNKIRVIKER